MPVDFEITQISSTSTVLKPYCSIRKFGFWKLTLICPHSLQTLGRRSSLSLGSPPPPPPPRQNHLGLQPRIGRCVHPDLLLNSRPCHCHSVFLVIWRNETADRVICSTNIEWDSNPTMRHCRPERWAPLRLRSKPLLVVVGADGCRALLSFNIHSFAIWLLFDVRGQQLHIIYATSCIYMINLHKPL